MWKCFPGRVPKNYMDERKWSRVLKRFCNEKVIPKKVAEKQQELFWSKEKSWLIKRKWQSNSEWTDYCQQEPDIRDREFESRIDGKE